MLSQNVVPLRLNPEHARDCERDDVLLADTPLMNGQYRIQQYLSSGGFGITYLAIDSLDRRVVIKECFADGISRRIKGKVVTTSDNDQRKFDAIKHRFVREAQSLARLKHQNIVGVHHIFKDNSTAYMALDYVDGQELTDAINETAMYLSPNAVIKLTRKLLTALDYVHSHGILHRDISPDNLMISSLGEPVLIDFGSARSSSEDLRSGVDVYAVKDGYSPQELYVEDAAQGRWTDFYSLGATLYHLITGEAPPSAADRLSALAAQQPDPYISVTGRNQDYPSTFLDAIDTALALLPADRYQTAKDWRMALSPAKTEDAQSLRTTLLRPEDEQERDAETQGFQPETVSTDPGQPVRPRRPDNLRTTSPDTDKTPTERPVPLTPQALSPERSGEAALPSAKPTKSKAMPLLAALLIMSAIGAGSYLYFGSNDPKVPPVTIAQDQILPTQADGATPVISASSPKTANTPGAVGDTGRVAQPILVSDPSKPIKTASNDIVAFPDSAPIQNFVLFETNAPLILGNAPKIAEPVPTGPTPAVRDTLIDPTPGTSDAPVALTKLSASEIDLDSANLRAMAKTYTSGPAPYEPMPKPDPVSTHMSFAVWNLVMPFQSEIKKVRNAHVAVVAVVPVEANTINGAWITEGTEIHLVNGERLTAETSLETLILKSMIIDPDGKTRASIQYRDPVTQRFERTLLTVPVAREVWLADGTKFHALQKDGQWTVEVVSVGAQTEGQLEAGDLLIRENNSGTNLNKPESLEDVFDRVASAGPGKASILIQRGQEQVSAILHIESAP